MPAPNINKAALEVLAPAKLNFTFELLGLSPAGDGYHEVRTLMSTIALADKLHFKIETAAETTVNILPSRELPSFPLGEDNLIVKAVRILQEVLGNGRTTDLNIAVSIDKQIPIGAGMAGGSANAAATLVAVNEYLGSPLSKEELLKLGSRLGADVPFCLCGGLRTGTGRGDQLSEDLNDQLQSEQTGSISELNLVIAKPTHLSISTPWAYKSWDEAEDLLSLSEKLRDRGINEGQDPSGYIVDQLRHGDLTGALKAFGNDFEQVVFTHYQQLKDIKQTFLKQGALSCHMTGSGPTIYAVAASAQDAEALKKRFQQEYCKSEGVVCATKYDPIELWTTSTCGGGARVIRKDQ